MSETIRCFLALDTSNQLKQYIRKIQHTLFEGSYGIKWAKPEDVHITLKFLGNQNKAMIPQIIDNFKRFHLPEETVHIRINQLGCFPTQTNPRVIWVGFQESKPINLLFQSIENALAALGLDKETRPFKPHMTIGRVKTIKNKPQLIQKLNRKLPKLFDEKLSTLAFYKSTLSSQGSIYEPLHKITFA